MKHLGRQVPGAISFLLCLALLAGPATAAHPQSSAADSIRGSRVIDYIRKNFTAPVITEALGLSEGVELVQAADGITLKTGYLGSSNPESVLKPAEILALEALAARDNFKKDRLPVFTLGTNLSAGYSVGYNGNELKVRHMLKGGKAPAAVIEGGIAVYEDAYPDTSVLYLVSTGQCQEMLLLESEKAPSRFEYEYSKEVTLNEKGNLAVNGLTLSRPVIFDATGKKTDGYYKKISDKRVLLAFDGTGLRYPLLIDPTWQVSGGSMAAARHIHTATLLPNGKVLVAGGYDGGALSSAELYDPASGTFSATGSMAAARWYHTATLLPNGKVLVTGGHNGGALSSAELYDPASGTFSATGSMAAARENPTATLLPNGKVLVAGGANSGFLSSAELYDPASGTFSATGSMGTARYAPTATLLPNGKVLVAGGFNGGALSSAELYDPASGTFSATGSMAAARGYHTATLLPNGKVLVAGSYNGGANYSSSAEIYDPASGTFSATGSMAATRGYHTATLLPNGKVLVTGGYNGGALSSAELYDPASGTFSTTGSMAAARYEHAATLLPNGKVLVTGGRNSGALSSAELYIPSGGTGTFSATGSMAAARGYHTATLLPNGKVLVTGGGNGVYLSSAEIYDPDTGTFSATGSMAAARENPTATLLPNGKVLVAGGANSGFLSSAELYDPATGTFSATGSMGTARHSHTATLLPNGKVLVSGGYNSGGFLSSAEIYDPATGTFSATGSMGTARRSHTATLLPNGKVLVAGGYNGSNYLSSAELYDPASGTFSATGSMGETRRYHTATLLPNGKVLVSGGYGVGGEPLSSAEIYDPATGTFSATGSMGTARYIHTATLLPNGKVLVSGGYGVGGYLSSAEIYDPATGTFSATGSMGTARYIHTATLLPNGKVLVSGGYNSGGFLSSAEIYDPIMGPGVFSITPGSGLNNGSVNITNLLGEGFTNGATVALTKAGQANISAADVAVVSAGKITCMLPLNGAATGQWNVVVTNPDSQTGTLANGFAVLGVSPLMEALDTSSLIISTSGNAAWFKQEAVYYYGGSAAQSGVIGDSQQSYIETTVTGPATVGFYYKVSSEQNADFLKFYIDGVLKNSWSGMIDWILASYGVISGTHTLKWSYIKDGSDSAGSDAVWVDSVTVGPELIPPGKPLNPTVTGGLQVTLAWAAPGDDGYTGNVSSGIFQINYSSNPSATANIAENTVIISTNWVQGTTNTYILSGLNAGATYYLWVKARDNAGNWSVWSDTGSVIAPYFADNTTEISGIYWPVSGAWGDYNNDGYIDVATDAGGLLSRNNSNNTFTNINAGLPGLSGTYNNPRSWGDYNNDGFLDLAVTGIDYNYPQPAKVYRNNGNGTFTDINAGLVGGYYYPSVSWGDYDNDGYLDLAVGTWIGAGYVTRLYHNNGDGTFSEINAGLAGGASVAWGDYDNDGYLDLAAGTPAHVYHNNGDGTFTDISGALTYIGDGEIVWGDYDNDGYLDLVAAGGGPSVIYHNNGNGTFSNINAGLPGADKGPTISWADYDHDGDLDLAMNGKIYRNLSTRKNTIPNGPVSGFSADHNYNQHSITFHWNAGADAETSAHGLYYDIIVSTVDMVANPSWHGPYIVSVSSGGEAGAGEQKNYGNSRFISSNLQPGYILRSLSENTTYYWKVRTIDTGRAKSAWSDQQASYVPYAPPVITSITPNNGINTVKTNITDLAGANFRAGAMVKLTKTGQADIVATGVEVLSAASIDCQFPTIGAVIGGWNVVVTNTDGQSATLENGFSLAAPGATALSPSLTMYTSSAAVTWTSMPGANYVAVLATDSGYSGIISSATLSVNNASYTGLMPDTSYYFEVKFRSPDMS